MTWIANCNREQQERQLIGKQYSVPVCEPQHGVAPEDRRMRMHQRKTNEQAEQEHESSGSTEQRIH
jgi:hypothetical protein